MPAPSFTIQNSPADLARLGVPKGAGEFTPSELFTLRSLGWNLNRIHQAFTLLGARVKNESLSPPLVEFLKPLLEAPRENPSGKSELRIAWNHKNLRLDFSTLPVDSALDLALFWLPALNSFWERTLRRAAFQRMRRILPQAWFLIHEDPPPGAVIPGLQLTSWSQLEETNGRFWIVHNREATLTFANSVSEASRKRENGLPGIAIAHLDRPDEHSLLAHYEPKGERIDLQSLTFL